MSIILIFWTIATLKTQNEHCISPLFITCWAWQLRNEGENNMRHSNAIPCKTWMWVRRSCRQSTPRRAASASWPVYLLYDWNVEICRSTVQLCSAPTGGNVPSVGRPINMPFLWTWPERPPMTGFTGMWPLAWSCGSDTVDGLLLFSSSYAMALRC